MPSGDGKPHLVLRSYEKKVKRINSGRYLTQKLNLQGNPFVVFCTNEHCDAYIYRECALPFWSEDCPIELGVLRSRCPS